MKRIVLYIVFILTVPALCHGSTGLKPRLEYSDHEAAKWFEYSLVLEDEWNTEHSVINGLDLDVWQGTGSLRIRALDEIHGGIPLTNSPAPKDMVSMMSFVWAKMFGGVDIVAEVKDFAHKIRHKGRYTKASQRTTVRDSRNRWRFIVACRIDEQAEVAASLNNRGRLFGEGEVSLEINALDPVSEEIGLRMAYSGGDLDIRADRMTLTDTAEARLVVRF